MGRGSLQDSEHKLGMHVDRSDGFGVEGAACDPQYVELEAVEPKFTFQLGLLHATVGLEQGTVHT